MFSWTDPSGSGDTLTSKGSMIPAFFLLSVLALSLFLNLFNIQFGLPYIYGRNVEGRIVTLTINAMVTGDLNPHVAIYPHFQLYILMLAFIPYYLWGLATGLLTSRADLLTIFQTDPTALYAISRSVTAIFGTGCVLMVYLIARRYYGWKTAILASLFLACSPLLIINTHMVTPDVIMTFFILVACYYSMNILEGGKFSDYFLSGAAIGLATSTKYPGISACVLVVTAHILFRKSTGPTEGEDRKWGRLASLAVMLLGHAIVIPSLFYDISPIGTPFNHRFPGSGEKIILLIRGLAFLSGTVFILLPLVARKLRSLRVFINRHCLLILSAASCAVFSFIASPYLLFDISSTISSLLYHALTESKAFWGCEDTPIGWIYYIQLLRDGTSLPFTALFLIGTGYTIYRHRTSDLLLLSFAVIYYLFIGYFHTKFPRYIIPVLPFLAIFASSLVNAVSGITGSRMARSALLLLLLFAVPSFVTSLQWDLKMGKVNTRTLAKAWIEENIPRGSRIAIDALGPPIDDSYYDIYIFHKGELQHPLDKWAHYRLGKAKKVSVLRENDIEFAIVNSNTYSNYQRVSHIYPEEAAFYIELARETRLIKEFLPDTNPGPVIKVYSLDTEKADPEILDQRGR
jgi:hypothetical protein